MSINNLENCRIIMNYLSEYSFKFIIINKSFVTFIRKNQVSFLNAKTFYVNVKFFEYTTDEFTSDFRFFEVSALELLCCPIFIRM